MRPHLLLTLGLTVVACQPPSDDTGPLTDTSPEDTVAADVEVATDTGGAPDSTTVDTDADIDDTDADTVEHDTVEDALTDPEELRDTGAAPDTDVDDVTVDTAPDTSEDTVEDVVEDTIAPGRWIEIGTGITHFEAIEPGVELMLSQGYQGGFHIWGAFLGHELDPDGIYHEWYLMRGDEIVGGTAWEDRLSNDEDDLCEMAGVTVVMTPTFDPMELDGANLVMQLFLEDGSGAAFEAEIPIVSRCCVYLDDL